MIFVENRLEAHLTHLKILEAQNQLVEAWSPDQQTDQQTNGLTCGHIELLFAAKKKSL